MSVAFVILPEKRCGEFFHDFFINSAFTLEGVDISNKAAKSRFKDLEKQARNFGYNSKEMICYTYSGKLMNETFGLTNENAYPDDLCFVSIPDLKCVPLKVMTGARWFDDIVGNNTIRQNAIDDGLEPDYR